MTEPATLSVPSASEPSEESENAPIESSHVPGFSSFQNPPFSKLSVSASSPLQPPFAATDRVYAADVTTKRYYKAIVRQTQFNEGTWKVLVHFIGWNSRFDVWISADNILEETDECTSWVEEHNNKLDGDQKSAEILEGTKRKLCDTGDEPTPKKAKTSSTDPSRETGKHTNNDSVTSSTSQVNYFSDYCELPLTLQRILMEERDRIAPQREDLHSHRHVLPCSKNVSIRSVLKTFYKHVEDILKTQEHAMKDSKKEQGKEQPASSEKKEESQQLLPHLSIGQAQTYCRELGKMITSALTNLLLYNDVERMQYQEQVLSLQQQQVENKSVEKKRTRTILDIYPCIYLLRFLVILPMLLGQPKNVANDEWRALGPFLAYLIVILQEHASVLFDCAKNRYELVQE